MGRKGSWFSTVKKALSSESKERNYQVLMKFIVNISQVSSMFLIVLATAFFRKQADQRRNGLENKSCRLQHHNPKLIKHLLFLHLRLFYLTVRLKPVMMASKLKLQLLLPRNLFLLFRQNLWMSKPLQLFSYTVNQQKKWQQ